MKIRKLRTGFQLCFGEEMWTCTNGSKNYHRQLDFTFRFYDEWRLGWGKSGGWSVPNSIALTPSLRVIPWRKSVLASDKNIGNTYHGASLEIEWLGYSAGFSIGHNINTKKTLEI